ncbi:apolipoprotein D-like isoform X1 [Eurosta solidaginis]|uniref:apolipoprotein D-like isoform X1 n=1 Tax=Eurosta solidaginis TaxID=178769 RepID=UPI0035315BC2
MQTLKFLIASLAFIIFFTSTPVAAQVLRWGKCPNVTTVPNFNITEYFGEWREYGRYFFLFEEGARCSKATYAPISSDEISVVNTQLNWKNEVQSLEGTATIVAPAKLLVKYNPDVFTYQAEAKYWVLATDYKNYAVVWSCMDLIGSHAEALWILVRSAKPSEDVITKAKNAILAQGISLKGFKVTDQSNCN